MLSANDDTAIYEHGITFRAYQDCGPVLKSHRRVSLFQIEALLNVPYVKIRRWISWQSTQTCSYPNNYAEHTHTNSTSLFMHCTIGLSFAVQIVQLVYLDQLWIAFVTVIWWPQGIITQIPRFELATPSTNHAPRPLMASQLGRWHCHSIGHVSICCPWRCNLILMLDVGARQAVKCIIKM